MKIAFLMTQSVDSPLGIGRVGPLARELARLGHRVWILCLHPDIESLAQRRFERDGVTVEYVAQMHVSKRGNVKTYFSPARTLRIAARATWELTRAALRVRADSVHVCKPHPMNGVAGLVASRLGGARLIVDCDDYEAAMGRFQSARQRSVVAFFEKALPRAARMVTTNTYFLKDLLEQWGVAPGRILYLSNGVERSRFAPPAEGELAALRSALGLAGKRVVVFVGSLGLPGHPVDLLLDAFARLHAALPDTALLLVGGGNQFEALQRQAAALGVADAVRFTGRVAPETIARYYHLAAVSVDPVRADDAARGREPLKLFESWACGVPFVTADVGDRRRLAGSPPALLLVEPGDPEALAAGIRRLLEGPAEAAELARLGGERVQGYFWDALALQAQRVYAPEA